MVALWVRMGYCMHMPGSGHLQSGESMSHTPRLTDRLRQLVAEMRAEDERQQAQINALLDKTQHHLRLLEMDLKDD